MPLLGVIFFGTFVLRLVIAWNLPLKPGTPDYAVYSHLGKQLAETGEYGFGDNWRDDPLLRRVQYRYLFDRHGTALPPGYPAVLAVLHNTVGDNPRTLQVVLALMCGLTAVLVYKTGWLLFDRTVGVTAAVFFAFSPGDAWSLTWLIREPLITLLIAGGVYFTFRTAKNRALPWAVATGLWFGLAGYVKETVAVFGMVLAGWLLLTGLRRGFRYARAPLLIMFLIVGAMMPWIVRNSLCYGRRVGMSNFTGTAMWPGIVDTDWRHENLLGNLDISGYISKEEAATLNPYTAENPADADRRVRSAIWIYTTHNLPKVITASVQNVVFYWLPVSREMRAHGLSARPQEIVSIIFYLCFFPLAVAGFYLYRHMEASRLLVIGLLAVTLLHCLFPTAARYRIPFEVVLFPFAAATFSAIIKSGDAA